MRRLQKLINVSRYLETFSVPGYDEIKPARVVDGDNATSLLSKAGGQQLLVALPEGRAAGRNNDTFTENVSLAFFALAKINGPSRTQALADQAYGELLLLCQAAVEKLSSDLIGDKTDKGCPLLAGLNITDVAAIPVYSTFGGWSGWSVELTLE